MKAAGSPERGVIAFTGARGICASAHALPRTTVVTDTWPRGPTRIVLRSGRAILQLTLVPSVSFFLSLFLVLSLARSVRARSIVDRVYILRRDVVRQLGTGQQEEGQKQ